MSPRYIVFTIADVDVLVRVTCRKKGQACPSDAEVEKMRKAVSTWNAKHPRSFPDPEKMVHLALDESGYTGCTVLHRGLICHVEL